LAFLLIDVEAYDSLVPEMGVYGQKKKYIRQHALKGIVLFDNKLSLSQREPLKTIASLSNAAGVVRQIQGVGYFVD
jgi:hypothetical protein